MEMQLTHYRDMSNLSVLKGTSKLDKAQQATVIQTKIKQDQIY